MKLTKGQKAFMEQLRRDGFVEHKVAFGRSQRNRCGWALVDMGLAEFGFGPKGSWLKTQGYMLKEAE